jgi:hypothetical protein
MENTNWMEKAKQDIDFIIVKLAYRDYYNSNFKNGKRRSKKHIPYSLSQETNEAREIYSLIYGKDTVSKEIEETIKAYLLPFRTGKREIVLP